MTTTDQQAVTVAQEDREAAQIIANLGPDILRGIYREDFARLLARHRLASVSSASADWTRTKAFDEAAAECMRAAEASTFADTVSEDERNGYRSACNLMAMNFRVMASRAAPELATQPATSQEGEDEEKTDWWNGFTGDFLTDGKGQASTAVWDRCRAAFDAAWPSGKIAAVDAAIAALAATPTPPTLSEDLRERLFERASGIQTMLGEPMWKPSRSHIEAARNLLFEAANAFSDDAGEPPNGDEAAKARESDSADLVVVAQRILDRGYVSSSIEEEREDHNALAAALARAQGQAS